MDGIKLVVTAPFADYATGDEITDQQTIIDILESESASRVVKVAVTGKEA